MSTAPNLPQLEQEALDALASANTDADLELWRVTWLGRQDGRVTALLRSIREQPPEQRADFGAATNALKAKLESAFDAKREAMKSAALRELATTDALDVTLPGRPQTLGRLHPVTQTMRDCLDVFRDLGFRVVEGPEVEWARYNFDGVRIPEDHPARDMWDTIWVDTIVDGERSMLLRT
ncbi:MAG: phenylalanine--tRNA ligase subunit alpha, partial [Tepidiformaceae bacterium]